MDKNFKVYILYSKKIDRYYVGISSNLEWRLQQHNRGLSPYTRGKGPWEIVYSKEFPSRSAAQVREKEIKNWKSRELMNKNLELNRQSGPGTSNDQPG
jgi:putative endonuclease